MSNRFHGSIAGLLCDLDGVLYVGNEPIEGAVSALELLRKRNIPIRFCTNTTVLSDNSLLKKLHRMGLPIEKDELFGAIRATVAFLKKHGNPSCHLLLTDDPKQDFSQFPQSDTSPQFVVVGDMGKVWDYRMMQHIFELIMNGAELVALHKGRYWRTETGLRIDIGAFVAGLEYVTGREATIVGKPSRSFFEMAVADLGLAPDRVAMVGDDINSDIGGAQVFGLKTVLVRTGKYRDDLVASSGITPDLVIDSIANLPEVID